MRAFRMVPGVLALAGLALAGFAGPARAQTSNDGAYYGVSYSAPTYQGYSRYSRTHKHVHKSAASSLDEQVLAEINEVRTHPQRYAERLRAFRANYHGDVVREPGDAIGVRTNEGVAALDEAIAYVEHREPLRPLAHNARLAAAAQRLTEGEGPRGTVGHIGPDGSTPYERMKEAGVWAGISEENISFGQDTAEAVVRQLIIDDGVPGRGHRSSIFEPGLSVAGVSCGPHIRWGWMCVIDVAGALAVR